ncbi:beta-hexosaminidase subunit beta-like [Pectinophora gossypiella]|uniref:beta-hexosaminidase subunit beta-like n=1 Tax=Pectinophora gossypiella TaxID=13191 RepID=UPI00214EF7F6|nr:beta-hexosaminidase subunit beta-like [Pectinophora gossypiella]
MSRVIILCALASVTVALGPFKSPIQGNVWPKPFSEEKGYVLYKFIGNFFFWPTQYDCERLKNATDKASWRIKNLLRMVYKYNQDAGNSDTFKNINLPVVWKFYIHLKQPCEAYPHADMDESYNLTIGTITKLTSNSIWGMIRGLETFSQLFYISDDFSDVLVNSTIIYDYPQYRHRGILVDTSRHYLSMDTMHKLLDGMATNKMNVLHWHMVDDQSFPYKSEKFPELSKEGAYYPSLTYDKNDVEEIIDYAAQQGIRVIPEFDTPGHVTSWGLSHPEIMTQCRETAWLWRPLNPVKNETYDLLRELFREVQDMFPERYFHLGGDEVFKSCWQDDPITQQYMKEHNMSTDDLYGLYMNNTMKLLKNGTVPIMWEEAYFNNKTDMINATVQAWRSNSNMAEMIKRHINVIYSTGWYLDSNLTKRFDDFYKFEPRLIAYDATGDHSLDKYIIGGEACMWGEMVDDSNILSRIFPRASAVAEVLWSVTNGTVPDDLFNRMEEHACRMIQDGYPAAPPSKSGFCITMDNVVKAEPKPKLFTYHQANEPSRSEFSKLRYVKHNRTKTP